MIDVGVVFGRFQILNLKHLEYILAAKMRCKKLYIGITLPNGSYTPQEEETEEKMTKSANPLTYFERLEMIRDTLLDFKVPREDFEIVPFPVENPEFLLQYVPEEAVCFMGICDEKTRKNEELLEKMGYKTEVLWRRDEKDKGVSGSQVRQRILADERWNDLVPRTVYDYIISHGIDNRIRYTK